MFNSIKKVHHIDIATRQIHELSLHQMGLNIPVNDHNDYDITQHVVSDLSIDIKEASTYRSICCT